MGGRLGGMQSRGESRNSYIRLLYYVTVGQRARVSRHGVVALGTRSTRAKCHREFCKMT
jgi:hypothetical protein